MYKPYFVHRLLSGLCPFHLKMVSCHRESCRREKGSYRRMGDDHGAGELLNGGPESQSVASVEEEEKNGGRQESVNALTLYVMFFDSYHVQCCGFNSLCNYL